MINEIVVRPPRTHGWTGSHADSSVKGRGATIDGCCRAGGRLTEKTEQYYSGFAIIDSMVGRAPKHGIRTGNVCKASQMYMYKYHDILNSI